MKEKLTEKDILEFNNYIKYNESNCETYKKMIHYTIKNTFNKNIRLLDGCKTFVNMKHDPQHYREVIDIFVGGLSPNTNLKFENGSITMDDFAETMYEIHHFELKTT